MTDVTTHGEEGISDDYDGEQDEEEDDEIHETDFAALLGNWVEDPDENDALAEALQLDAVATVAWQRFKGKGKNKGNNLKRLAELKIRTNCQARGARGHRAGSHT